MWSGILSNKDSGSLSDNASGILSGHSIWRSTWQTCWHFSRHSVWCILLLYCVQLSVWQFCLAFYLEYMTFTHCHIISQIFSGILFGSSAWDVLIKVKTLGKLGARRDLGKLRPSIPCFCVRVSCHLNKITSCEPQIKSVRTSNANPVWINLDSVLILWQVLLRSNVSVSVIRSIPPLKIQSENVHETRGLHFGRGKLTGHVSPIPLWGFPRLRCHFLGRFFVGFCFRRSHNVVGFLCNHYQTKKSPLRRGAPAVILDVSIRVA